MASVVSRRVVVVGVVSKYVVLEAVGVRRQLDFYSYSQLQRKIQQTAVEYPFALGDHLVLIVPLSIVGAWHRTDARRQQRKNFTPLHVQRIVTDAGPLRVLHLFVVGLQQQ